MGTFRKNTIIYHFYHFLRERKPLEKVKSSLFLCSGAYRVHPARRPGGIPPPRLNARRDRLTVAKMHKNGTPKKTL